MNIFSVVAWIPWFVFKSLNLSAGPVFFWSSACNRSEKPGRREFPPVKITFDIRPDRISASHLWTALLNVKFKIFVFRTFNNCYLILKTYVTKLETPRVGVFDPSVKDGVKRTSGIRSRSFPKDFRKPVANSYSTGSYLDKSFSFFLEKTWLIQE